MSGVVALSPAAMMALLGRPGEGVAFLTQLGADLAPTLTDEQTRRVREAAAEGTSDPAGEPALLLAAVAGAVDSAESRLTLVADLAVRRSLVAFRGDNQAAVIVFSGESILAGLITSTQLHEWVKETVAEAFEAGVHWTLARWRGAIREVAASGTGDSVLVSGADEESTRSALAAGSVSSLAAAITGQ
nr:hypothetical protein [Propionibacterium sp.]